MEQFKNQTNVLRLISEAAVHAGQLGGTYGSDLCPDFERAQQNLATSPDMRSQLLLVLSATRMLITQAEKKTIRLIVGDDPITGSQMSHLVRIRLICAELIGLITSTLDGIKGRAAFGRPA